MARNGFLTCAVVACALAGCGSDEGDVKNSVNGYLDAIADGDAETACDQLNGAMKRETLSRASELGATSCAKALDAVSANLGDEEAKTLRDAEIIDVKVTGGTATAKVKGAPGTAELTKTSAGWRISGGLF